MKKRQTIKNIKRVSCRFDMDIPEEGRAWQILQSNYQEPPDGKKQDYTSDMNSYLYLLMEDMLFATAEGLCRKQGDMEKIVAGYLVEFYKREMAGTKER
ncbi:MAG: hypothetical protein HDR28_09270 [Lachnospiraceae bacterium]|nr:hypothetical protein [Lachnospiraceae bacterium]